MTLRGFSGATVTVTVTVTLAGLAAWLAVAGCAPKADGGAVDADRAVEGTHWGVVSIVPGGASPQVRPTASTSGGQPTFFDADVYFDREGGFTAYTGCVEMAGSAVFDTDTVDIVVSELPSCTEPTTLHTAVVATLQGEVAYDVDWQTLTLTGPDGTGLRLLPRS